MKKLLTFLPKTCGLNCCIEKQDKKTNQRHSQLTSETFADRS